MRSGLTQRKRNKEGEIILVDVISSATNELKQLLSAKNDDQVVPLDEPEDMDLDKRPSDASAGGVLTEEPRSLEKKES